MTSFNHAFEIAFSLVSSTQDGSDVTPAMFRAALLARVADLDASDEWQEAIGAPFDTYEAGEADQDSDGGCHANR